jgi:hypothetical protein
MTYAHLKPRAQFGGIAAERAVARLCWWGYGPKPQRHRNRLYAAGTEISLRRHDGVNAAQFLLGQFEVLQSKHAVSNLVQLAGTY